MKTDEYINIQDLYIHYKLEEDFITCIENCNIIEFIIHENVRYVKMDQIPKIEKIIRLKTDLNINLEGIEAITHMLDRISEMQKQIRHLRQKLSVYE